MTRFRTHQEMDAIYQERYGRGESGPIVLELGTESQRLIFFGSRHSNNAADEQWSQMEELWQQFQEHENDKRILIYERSGLDVHDLSREDSLRQYSESGLAAWLAQEAGIEAETGEPGQAEEIEHLKQSYSTAEIITYYFGRQMLQWLTQDKSIEPDWRVYAEDCISKYESLGCWDGESFDLERAVSWFKDVRGKEFDPTDREELYALSDPSQSAISSASGQFRDKHLFELIEERWHQGYDIFVIYGSGHALILEPVLKGLTGKNGSTK